MKQFCKPTQKYTILISILVLVAFVLNACQPTHPSSLDLWIDNADGEVTATPLPELTPVATRPSYLPGTIVDYVAQSGDTVPALAIHFNTTVAEIREANPIIPEDATTMPPGMPMKIPIYYDPIWSSSYQIIPDIAFVNGPRGVDFDVVDFVNQHPGWLKDSRHIIGEEVRSGAGMVIYISEMFSVSPQLLLAILEYQTGALSNSTPPDDVDAYPLGYRDIFHQGVAQQLVWAANFLNNGYYTWRDGSLKTYKHSDGRLERPDPWQNAASAALQYYFSQIMGRDEYAVAVSANGLAHTYAALFGDPWQGDQILIPGSLRQPEMILPFAPGQTWAYTGGPHTGWGLGAPFSAIDFAPATNVGGCTPAIDPALAVADGVISRKGIAFAVLDLDGDGDERTGWSVFYLHLLTTSIPPVGTQLKQGDPIGLPSCEGGKSTGTHVHIARKYNGEWILAGDIVPFNMEGWITGIGGAAYSGTMKKNGLVKTACVCSDQFSQITAQGLTLADQ
ncbi:MAG: hypothetical protein CVU39_25075 [Chloroflexi bacterium HGW-Chloroflexi-10]|nr:MAG: hypothetical protein CVU39_25075 [Chloroflexi bacterium HGW-Chloroflexi-10]